MTRDDHIRAIRQRAVATSQFRWIKAPMGSFAAKDRRPATREVEAIRQDVWWLLDELERGGSGDTA